MVKMHPFREQVRSSFSKLLEEARSSFAAEETLRIDLHCHDRNSDVPDELWGRILRLPETWLETAELLRCLRSNQVDVPTITNHNNARSCWDLLDRGEDILPAAEFSCTFPDFQVGVHVLTFGFTPEQETRLAALRHNAYKFLEYTCEQDLPTSLAHPLYFYALGKSPSLELFEKFALLFERFEVLNGQRDAWQNLLTATWLQGINEEKLHSWSRKHGISPGNFCRNPYRKRMTGGSDDHMGIFAGSCGTLLRVPDLQTRRKDTKLSQLALEALRTGETAPYGAYSDEEKLGTAFLDYFCQVAMHMEDPGLLRMFLHRGTLKDKLMCLGISNAMQELKRHNYTMRFLRVFHEAMSGSRPSWVSGLFVSKAVKPLLESVDELALARRKGSEPFLEALRDHFPKMGAHLQKLLADRVAESIERHRKQLDHSQWKPGDVVRRFELPSHLRSLMSPEEKSRGKDISQVDLSGFLDGLSFPALATGVLAGSSFAASKVLCKSRPFLDAFSGQLGKFQHPRRALWLTDTFFDRNGVSSVLQSMLTEVQERDLPIDFLVCDAEAQSQPHLHVLRSVTEFSVPIHPDQRFRLPDLLELQTLFREGGYDRVICSTELFMGCLALYLKSAFSVPAYFYMHTDWLDYFEKSGHLDKHSLDRVRRTLRALYQSFDGIFTLNREHQDWLAGPSMAIPSSRIFSTSHWVSPQFKPQRATRSFLFDGVREEDPVLLFAGRLSEEKGVMDLPGVYSRVKEAFPAARFIFLGVGPAESRLRIEMPDAQFLGWVEQSRLPAIYSCADLLLLPSRFDTFGCVVLEAMSCGLPVAAYNCKGPKDIIRTGKDGYLSETPEEMAGQVIAHLSRGQTVEAMKAAAFTRSRFYRADTILARMMADLKLESLDEHGKAGSASGKWNEAPAQAVTQATRVSSLSSGLLKEILELVGQ